MPVLVSGFHSPDLVNHVHSFQYLPEYAVTEMVLMLPLMVQKRVVNRVDEELAGSRIDHRSTGHRESAALVQQTIGRLVFNGKLRFFHLHIFIHAAALNHEVLDNPVKYQSVVMAVLDVG